MYPKEIPFPGRIRYQKSMKLVVVVVVVVVVVPFLFRNCARWTPNGG